MTDYPDANSRWRKRQIAAKWRSLVSIFITVVLLLAVFNGFAKSLSLSDYFGKSTREGSRALVAVTNTTPGSILIFQPDDKKLVLATFDPRVYFATGDPDLPIKQLGEIFGLSDGNRMRYELAQVTKIPVGHFIFLDDRTYFSSRESFGEFFKNLAAVTTPLRILVGEGLVGVKETNLTRSDLLVLWWQAKSLGVNDLIFTNLWVHTSEIVLEDGQKVAGLDSFAVARFLAAYIEDRKILEEGKKVSVVNASGIAGSGQLASDLVSVAGIKIVKVAAGQSPAVTSVVVSGGSSYTARYLAKILECDIKTRQDMAEEEIEVVIGQDFARKYRI